jgi:hypothetical protein
MESIYGGYPYLLHYQGIYISHSSGLTWGGDLRWNTPAKGLLVGASYENNDLTNTGVMKTAVAPGGPTINVPYSEYARREFIQQFYGEYVIGNLRLDAEFRRFWRDYELDEMFDMTTSPKTWYVSADYRLSKRFALGAYYSHFVVDWYATIPNYAESPSTSSPDRHLYDKVVALRFDVTSNWYAKVEGHFMDGYAGFKYPDGFYPLVNPQGLKPNTNALVIRTGWSF